MKRVFSTLFAVICLTAFAHSTVLACACCAEPNTYMIWTGKTDTYVADLLGEMKFDAKAERWGIDVRGHSREELTALIEGSTREIPITEHLRLHQEASDFVRWGRRGAKVP